MTQIDDISALKLEQFLNEGAFLRTKEGRVLIWSGPFEKTFLKDGFYMGEEHLRGVSYRNFYSNEVFTLQSSQNASRFLVSDVRQKIQNEMGSRLEPMQGFSPPSEEKFKISFQTIMGKVQRGEIEKAVPVVFSESPTSPNKNQKAHLILNSLESHEELYAFGFWNQTGGVIGATPEVLFHIEAEKVSSMALAGTAPVEQIQNLKSDPKEIHEHNLVIKDVSERLKYLGWVRVEATKAVKIGSVAHLRTELSIQAQKIDLLKLLNSLHPTAALGVYPRNYGISWMKELPYQDQRSIFGAPILFPISNQEVLALVAIRCLQWNLEGSQIGTGCGLVNGSFFEKEWAELALKRNSVFKSLGISS